MNCFGELKALLVFVGVCEPRRGEASSFKKSIKRRNERRQTTGGLSFEHVDDQPNNQRVISQKQDFATELYQFTIKSFLSRRESNIDRVWLANGKAPYV